MSRPTLTFTFPDPIILQAAAGDYRILLAPIDQPSDDGRVIVGSLGWRAQVPLMFSDSEEGHGDARHVGNIQDLRIEAFNGRQWAIGRVDWDADELATEAKRLVDEVRFNGVSIHLGRGRFADVCPSGGSFREVEFPGDWVPVEVNGELVSFNPPCETLLSGVFEAELAAATIVAIPAFADARIEAEGQTAGQIMGSLTFNAQIDSDGKPWAFAVSGSSSLPIGDRDRAWDAAAAQRRMFGDDDDNPDFARARKGHFFVRESGDKKGDYALPFADVIDGTLTAIPRGIFACAGGRGVDATQGISASDKDAIKGKICAWYSKMREKFDDDSLVCPFDMMAATVPVASDDLVPAEWVQRAASLDRPPRDWFDDPKLEGPTPLTVSDDGRVLGHLALWDTCHTGFQGRCVQVPHNADYSMFLTARVFTDDGQRVPVGPLVVDDGHAPAFWSVDKVVRYYADTRLAAAYVTIGEDDHGVWVAGSVSHKATPGQIETLRRHALSGDWRKTDGVTRLVAAVSVNGPGFIVPEVLVASGEEVGLVTYGPEPVVDKPTDLALVYAALVRLTELIEHPQMTIVETIVETPDPEIEVLDAQVASLLTEELEAEVEAALSR